MYIYMYIILIFIFILNFEFQQYANRIIIEYLLYTRTTSPSFKNHSFIQYCHISPSLSHILLIPNSNSVFFYFAYIYTMWDIDQWSTHFFFLLNDRFQNKPCVCLIQINIRMGQCTRKWIIATIADISGLHCAPHCDVYA